MTCAQEHLADRRAARRAARAPDRGQHVRCDDDRAGPPRSERGRRRAQPRRCRRRRPASATRAAASRRALCSSTSALPPSVPPTSRTTSGRAARSAATSGGVQRTGVTCTTRAAGRQRDPVAGLGRDLPLVADDREPQPAAGAGAGEHVVGPHARAPRSASRPDGVDAVQHVGRRASSACDAVARSSPVPSVDERGLGERRPDVDADEHGNASGERPVEVGDQVVGVLDADRSRTRSAGTSSGEPATEACVIRPGCSMSDSRRRRATRRG